MDTPVSSQLSSSEKLHFNNLFYSDQVKPFIWTVPLFEGIKMTAFNRPNTERSKRLQIINRSDCYLEYLPAPGASQPRSSSPTWRTIKITAVNSTRGRVDWWGGLSLLFPLQGPVISPWLIVVVSSEGAARSRLVTFQAGQPSVTSRHYLNTNNVSSHCSDH